MWWVFRDKLNSLATYHPQLRAMKLPKLELILLGVNLFVLGGIVVLMALRGPSTASVLLLIGTAGMAIGKIGRAWAGGIS
jgi:hypothetical protein